MLSSTNLNNGGSMRQDELIQNPYQCFLHLKLNENFWIGSPSPLNQEKKTHQSQGAEVNFVFFRGIKKLGQISIPPNP